MQSRLQCVSTAYDLCATKRADRRAGWASKLPSGKFTKELFSSVANVERILAYASGNDEGEERHDEEGEAPGQEAIFRLLHGEKFDDIQVEFEQLTKVSFAPSRDLGALLRPYRTSPSTSIDISCERGISRA